MNPDQRDPTEPTRPTGPDAWAVRALHDQSRALVAKAYAAYLTATEESGPADEWDRQVIDQVIRALVTQGEPFSVNDMRPLLPAVRKCLISRRLIKAQESGWIRKTGYTPSTLHSTHAAEVKVYTPIEGADLTRQATPRRQRVPA